MSERLNDYFATEAGDYLDQLERLLDLPGVPDADHLLRLATGVRGSAQMAQADTVAGVAERLEDAARAMLTHDVAWSDELRSLAARTVADLKLLVRALNRWGPEEEERVRIALSRWDQEDGSGGEAEPLPMLGADESAVVVPISSLYFDDGGPHVVQRGAEAVTPGQVSDEPAPSANEESATPASESVSATFDEQAPHLESEAPSTAPREPATAPTSVSSPSQRGAGSEAGESGIPSPEPDTDASPSTDADADDDAAGAAVVPVEDLLLRGESALLEAIALRPTFESFARGDAVPDRSLADVVQELFDLVEQGITPDRPEV